MSNMQYNALFKITYGMYICAARDSDRMSGCVVNTIFQVAAQPATVAVSVHKENFTHSLIQKSGVFSATILSQKTPLRFFGHFGFKSGRDVDKFKDVRYKIGKTGAPIVLDWAVGYLEAKLKGSFDAGTHTIFVGEVVNAEALSNDEPMTYAFYRDKKSGTASKHAPTFIKQNAESKEVYRMKKYRCILCGYIYDPAAGDPDGGVQPGTAFEKIPEDWVCPLCGAAKSEFEPVDE